MTVGGAAVLVFDLAVAMRRVVMGGVTIGNGFGGLQRRKRK